MTIDTDLLKRTMRAVEQADERGEWNQGAWRIETAFGTAYCFAGWVAQLEGREDQQGQLDIGDWAEWRLGLTQRQADCLFNGANTLDDLRDKVNQLCALAERTDA